MEKQPDTPSSAARRDGIVAAPRTPGAVRAARSARHAEGRRPAPDSATISTRLSKAKSAAHLASMVHDAPDTPESQPQETRKPPGGVPDGPALVPAQKVRR